MEAQELFDDDADRALCKEIGPLLREETDRANAFLATGDPGSPARRTAIPKFKDETLEWANRIQAVLKSHVDQSRFLTRTVQQYIDGMLLYSENLHEDRGADAFDKPTYDAAVVAAGGPLSTCYKLGVGW